MNGDGNIGQVIPDIAMNPFFIVGFVVILLVTYLLYRRIQRKKRLEHLIRQIPVHLVGLPRKKDIEADLKIRQARDEIAFNWMKKAPFSPKAFYDLSVEVVRAVAEIYHPKAKDPIKKASVKALMDLNRRVSARLSALLNIVPFNLLGSVDMGLVATLKDGVDYIKNHPLTQRIKDHPIAGVIKKIPFADIGKAMKIARKVKTPMGMVLQAGKEITIEGVKRLFLSELVGIVAEEAMTIYSGRAVRDERSKAELLTLYTLAQILRDQKSASADEHHVFRQYLVELKRVDHELKLFLLAYAMRDESLTSSFMEELFYQTGLVAQLRSFDEDSAEKAAEIKKWEKFCDFEDFTHLKELKGEKLFLEALERLALAEGPAQKLKMGIWESAKKDLLPPGS